MILKKKKRIKHKDIYLALYIYLYARVNLEKKSNIIREVNII